MSFWILFLYGNDCLWADRSNVSPICRHGLCTWDMRTLLSAFDQNSILVIVVLTYFLTVKNWCELFSFYCSTPRPCLYFGFTFFPVKHYVTLLVKVPCERFEDGILESRPSGMMMHERVNTASEQLTHSRGSSFRSSQSFSVQSQVPSWWSWNKRANAPEVNRSGVKVTLASSL